MKVFYHPGEAPHTVGIPGDTFTGYPTADDGLVQNNLTNYWDFPEYRAVSAIYKYCSPTFFFLAILGNALAFTVFAQKQLRRKLSSQLYMVLAVVDAATVFFLCIFFLPDYFDSDAIEFTDTLCKIMVFSHLTLHTLSPWVVVVIALQRFIVVVLPHRAADINTRRRYFTILLVVTLVIISCYWPVIITTGLEQNGCYVVTYVQPLKYWDVRVFIAINLTLSIITPFIGLFILNSGILVGLVHARIRYSKRLGTGIAMIFTVSFVFIVLNIWTPLAMWVEYHADVSVNSRQFWRIRLFREIGFQLSSFNHCVNIFLYCLTGTHFRKGLKDLLRCSTCRNSTYKPE